MSVGLTLSLLMAAVFLLAGIADQRNGRSGAALMGMTTAAVLVLFGFFGVPL